MKMTIQDIKITQDRIAVIIGKKGSTRRTIEEKTGTTITINSEDGIVTVESEDAIAVMRTIDFIRAVNRGFSPERAGIILDDEDLMLDIIDLSRACTTTKQIERFRGRIIGRNGKSREQIEDLTGTILSVYNKTVAIIGMPEQVKLAQKALEMILEGLPHEVVFAFLDKKKKEAKYDMLEYYY